jgi:hypothetical protein
MDVLFTSVQVLCAKAVTVSFFGVLEGSAYTCVSIAMQLVTKQSHMLTVLHFCQNSISYVLAFLLQNRDETKHLRPKLNNRFRIK